MMLLVAFLMISRIPTLSLKKTKIKADWMLPLMVFCVFLISSLLTKPWLTLGAFTLCYVLTIPLTIVRFLREKSAAEKEKISAE